MTESDGFQLPDTAKDVGIAIGSVVIVFLVTFAYSGNWPPMVVIESGSMDCPSVAGLPFTKTHPFSM